MLRQASEQDAELLTVIALSRSASLNTMLGALPPHSIVSFLRPSAAWRARILPTRVDPVKLRKGKKSR